jgi:23S rRNA-/tRNA-specific pseudouridylate synthase
MDVSNFSYIYIHMDNNFSDTSGFLLVGKTVKYFVKEDEFEIRQSRKAYIALCKWLSAMMEKRKVYIICSWVR